MTELHATISAKAMKRAIYPAYMLNDKGVFKIDGDRLTCQAVNPETVETVEVIMPAKAWDNFTAQSGLPEQAHEFEIDLKWMMAVVNCTPDDAPINVTIDHGKLYLKIGMHTLSRRLIDPVKIHKSPKNMDRSYTVMMDVSGGFFAAMIKYLAAIKAIGLEICAYKDDVRFNSAYDTDDDPGHYSISAVGLTEYLGDARGIYSIEYLVDIAAGIQPNDKISLQFGTDTPIAIGYIAYGCEIRHTLAPRIEV